MSLIGASPQRNLGLRATPALVPRIFGNRKSPARNLLGYEDIPNNGRIETDTREDTRIHARARTHTHTPWRKKEREKERERVREFRCLAANVRNSRGEFLKRNAPSGSYPEFPPLYCSLLSLSLSSTLTHPPSLSSLFLSSYPFLTGGYAKTEWKEKRETKRERERD